MANPVGRPLKFPTPQAILDKATVYFDECRDKKVPITVTGLCLALGTFRDVLMDYQDERGEEFSNAVKACKLVCENYAELQAFVGKNPAAAIFALKNYGWSDKQELDHTSKGEKLETGVKVYLPNNAGVETTPETGDSAS